MIEHIVFVASEPERAIGLEGYLPNFHIITVNGNISTPLSKMPNVHVVSSEAPSISTAELLNLPETKEILDKIARTQEIGIMVFKNDSKIEQFCANNGYTLLNESSTLNQRFERKLNQYTELSRLENIFPPTKIATLEEFSFVSLSQEFGIPFVVQYDRGHTGNSTLVITRPEQFSQEQDKYPKREARISKYIDGLPVTLNCCATKFGTLSSGLCVQITGLPECTSNLGTTIGNDWAIVSQLLSHSQIAEIERISSLIGDYMHQQGYKGMFGCDLIVSPEKIYLIEVNARQTASVGLHTKLLLERGVLPLSLFHIAEFIGQEALQQLFPAYSPTPENIEALHITRETPFIASQLIVRNTAKVPANSGSSFTTGVYNGSTYLKSDYEVKNLQDDEYLVYVAPTGRQLEPEDEVFRVINKKGALLNQHQLLPEIKEIVNILSASNTYST